MAWACSKSSILLGSSPSAVAASATTFPSRLLEGALESIFSKNGRRIDKFTCCPVSTPAPLWIVNILSTPIWPGGHLATQAASAVVL